MKVSLNTIKQYTDVDLSVDDLVAKINAQLGGVEEVINLGEHYKGAVIIKVVSCEKHPNADKLHVCTIDDGGKTTGVKRDKNGYVQVVCGAPNVKAGMCAVWLPPGATVPVTFEDKEPFVLGARELRGVVSNGMLASPKELGLGDSHEGLLVINPNELKPSGAKIKPGVSFAAAYSLDDVIIDVENKMFTHRPDLFGQLGVAREIAGIQHQQFSEPAWYWHPAKFSANNGDKPDVFNEAKNKVPRFMAVVVRGVEVKPSPVWLQCELVRMGSKPINNIVDATNYIMLTTAQPTHAYDYDKLSGGSLGARMAKKGEQITLLNGKTYQLNVDDILIVDGQGPVGLGGVMGGKTSEVSASTKNIMIEVATFDMYSIRKTSMRHGLFTDAVTRFNKGQSPLQNDRVLAKLIDILEITNPCQTVGEVADIKDKSQNISALKVQTSFINQRLGLELTDTKIAKLLSNVQFKVLTNKPGELDITAPFWRTDIAIAEDIVEEVGRLYGFDNLPLVLPPRDTEPTPIGTMLNTKSKIRRILKQAGANEVLTYSFVHGDLLTKVGQKPDDALRLSNALSPNLHYYRLSLTPSLLDKVHLNQKAGFETFGLFELGKAHNTATIDADGVPKSLDRLAFVYASSNKASHSKSGAAYFSAQSTLDYLLKELHINYTLKPLSAPTAPFEPSRSAQIVLADGTLLGVIGEYTAAVNVALKLPNYCAGFELDSALISVYAKQSAIYVPLPKYPKVSQDISLKVKTSVLYADVYKALQTTFDTIRPSDVWAAIEPLDIYQPDDAKTKHLTFRLSIASYERTLNTTEVNDLLDNVAKKLQNQIGAERI